jgi:RNA polymerase sigma-70 factor (ECF subfamily)
MSEKVDKIDLNAALTAYENGDDGAFDVIFEEMRGPLCFFINRYVNDPDVAEDLVMDTFAALLLNIKKFNRNSRLSTYLFTIARNKSIDYIRRNKNKLLKLDENTPDEDYQRIEEEYIRNEEYQRLHFEMRELSENYRTVLHLYYFEEMSVEDIAIVMRKNKKQIYNLLHRAREELKTRLGGNYEK